MKKILFIIIILTLALSLSFPLIISAEEIDGLAKNLNEILFEKNFSEEQIIEMNSLYLSDYSNYLLNTYLPAKQGLSKMETNSIEEEYNLEIERSKLNYSNGVKVTLLSTSLYLSQYTINNTFNYLFSENEYWSIPTDTYSDKGNFSLSGANIINIAEHFNTNYFGIILPNDTITFLKSADIIEKMLYENNETTVVDIKIFAYSQSLSFMYIQGAQKEYLVKLYDSTGSYKQFLPEISEFNLYPAKEVIDILAQKKPNTVGKFKPTYQTEAESLQERGLLKGNEKGLDLLKPLTRIEAATMLLRAMGQSETTTHTTPAFSDVPMTHWGFGAAENAFALGIINGIGNSLFAPDEAVTAEQFATMVLRAGHHSEFNWEDALDIMVNEGIISAEDASTMDFFARCDMAKIIYEAIEKGLF